jgi:hypothetical protein
VNELIFTFIWSSPVHRVKKELFQKDFCEGGLKLIIHCGDIFGTRLPFSVSCIGLTKSVLKGYNFGHLKIVGLQVVVSLFVTPIDRRSSHG